MYVVKFRHLVLRQQIEIQHASMSCVYCHIVARQLSSGQFCNLEISGEGRTETTSGLPGQQ